jgi:hypothetical protein
MLTTGRFIQNLIYKHVINHTTCFECVTLSAMDRKSPERTILV